MTPSDLKRARELCEAATPGPWSSELDVFDAQDGIVASVLNAEVTMLATISTDIVIESGDPWTEELEEQKNAAWKRARGGQELRDATFIAAARTLVPQLLDEVERLQAEVAVVKESRDSWEHRWRKTIGMAQEVQVEEETAERIAAWLEKRSPQSVPYQTTSIMTAGQIRSGAWRTEKP